jgi:beta-galactosidase
VPQEQSIEIVTVSAVDAAGRLCPTENNEITFNLTGPARILGHGNGDPSDHTPHGSSSRRLFSGLCQVIVQRDASKGRVVLEAHADGLTSASVTIH